MHLRKLNLPYSFYVHNNVQISLLVYSCKLLCSCWNQYCELRAISTDCLQLTKTRTETRESHSPDMNVWDVYLWGNFKHKRI
jgi:hypothetical protein